jgi:putative DNA primase/helicase
MMATIRRFRRPPTQDEIDEKIRRAVEQPVRPKADAVVVESRHDIARNLAWRYRANGLSEDDVLQRVLDSPEGRELVADKREAELARLVSSAFAKEPDHFHLTDLGNARRFAYEHADRARYSYTSRQWLAWSGRHWQREADAAIQRLAKRTVLGLYGEASRCENEDHRKRIAAHAAKSEGADRIAAMLRLARSEREMSTTDDVLDRDPMLLNVDNGTLDLSTAELRPHDPADLITHMLDVTYDPRATCPQWLAFLEYVLDDDTALVAFVKRLVGYILTGSTSEQILVLLYGPGNNGKTVFLEVLRALLGSLARMARFQSFLVKRNDGIPTDIARLHGARLVTAAESQEGSRLDEALVKQLTGGDTVMARFLYQKEFEFRPTFKLLLMANHRPVIRGTDLAIWRRVKLIPFLVTIPKSVRDPNLTAKLRGEMPGILAWAVEGCMEWQTEGLGTPRTVRQATATYRSDMDILGAFLSERCEVSKTAVVSAKALYAAYVFWCASSGERPVSKRAFGLAMEERGFESRREWVAAEGVKRLMWSGLAPWKRRGIRK